MVQRLAVQWDQRCVRFVLSDSGRRGRTTIIATGVVPVDSGPDPFNDRVSAALQTIITEHKAKKARLLVAVSRGAVDVARMSLPKTDEFELPALVANLIPREMPGLSGDASVDFIAFPVGADGMRPVTAVGLHGEDQSQIDSICATAGVKPCRILVAPYSLTALVEADPETLTLLISTGAGHVDLLVAKGKSPVVARTLRLPDSADARNQAENIHREVHRTLLSLSDEQIEPSELARLVLFGEQSGTTQLLSELAVEFDIVAESVDPFLITGGGCPEAAEHHSALAPLIGMTIEESNGVASAVDFVNPRKKPRQIGRRHQILAVSAVVALLVGAGWFYTWSQFHAIEQDNVRLQSRLADLKELNIKAAKKRRLDMALTAWDRSRVSWLDELRDLTLRMPPVKEVRIQQLAMSQSGDSYVATFDGVARNASAVELMEISLRDRWHQLRTPGIREQSGRRNTRERAWTFQTTMTFRPRKAEQYTSHRSDADLAVLNTVQRTVTENEKAGKK
ncbi:MAG: hypothetical protein VB858_03375 [Planctomycetaceae bacterium]